MLNGANEKTNRIYEAWYKKIRLREVLDSIAYEYWKYQNVFVYVKDGVPITLPVDKCRIGNTSFNGDPVVDYDCSSTLNEWRQKGYTVKENWIKDNNLEVYFEGYPKEVQEAMNKGDQFVQLNPKYAKVLQGPKESWQRYSIPMVAAWLPALAKKELIGAWENAVLNLGIHSFVHVRYGDEKKGQDILPDKNQLSAIQRIISMAMRGFPLAVTNQLAKSEVVQPDMQDLFQFDKYRDVNNDLLSAGGVSGILVSGVSEDGSTFASAQVSMQTAAARIESARDEICELMNKINVCIQEELAKSHAYNVSKVPVFNFMPLDMTGRKALREDCEKLWTNGLVSTRTYLVEQGYNLDKEKAMREEERSNGTDAVMVPRNANAVGGNSGNVSNDPAVQTDDGRGRPELTDEERTSDPDAAERGKMPKPSNPDGSMDDSV